MESEELLKNLQEQMKALTDRFDTEANIRKKEQEKRDADNLAIEQQKAKEAEKLAYKEELEKEFKAKYGIAEKVEKAEPEKEDPQPKTDPQVPPVPVGTQQPASQVDEGTKYRTIDDIINKINSRY